MKGLTSRQKNILDYIKQYILSHKYPPTIREVAERFTISVKGSYDHIKALEKKKFIKCTGNRSRAIEVVWSEEEYNVTKIPLLGNVAAGKPLFAEENFEGTIGIPSNLIRSGKHFALNVRGDSMKEAGIIDGDIAIIRHNNTADNGDIVVAMLDDSVTLKRFYKEKNRIMLKAENSAYPPIFSQDIKILGRLACIIRKYD